MSVRACVAAAGDGGRRTSSISGRAQRRQGYTERSRCARSAACASWVASTGDDIIDAATGARCLRLSNHESAGCAGRAMESRARTTKLTAPSAHTRLPSEATKKPRIDHEDDVKRSNGTTKPY